MNKGELTTKIKRYLKREDLDDLIPDWIEFGQRRIDYDLRLPQQEYRTTSIANLKFLPLPDDFIEMRNIQVDFDGGFPLEYLTPEQLDLMGRRLKGASPNPIQFYTIVDNQLELVPAPDIDSEVIIELFYYAREPALVNDSATTKILTLYPQLYIYSVMLEAMPFLEHQAGQASWQDMYSRLVDLLNTRAQAARFSGNSIQMRAV